MKIASIMYSCPVCTFTAEGTTIISHIYTEHAKILGVNDVQQNIQFMTVDNFNKRYYHLGLHIAEIVNED